MQLKIIFLCIIGENSKVFRLISFLPTKHYFVPISGIIFKVIRMFKYLSDEPHLFLLFVMACDNLLIIHF